MIQAAERTSYRTVFASSEFRALWFAQILSVAGDRLALVATSLLVYAHTHSPVLTAITYASIYLPWLLGGPFLSGLADRFPRRVVMVTCDIGRALLVAGMVLPGCPVLVVVILLFAVTTLQSPFQASRTAIVADVLHGESYVLGVAVTRLTNQLGYVAGFAVGGTVVAFSGTRTALLIDCGTFIASALLVRFGVRGRPAPIEKAARPSTWGMVASGAKLVFGQRKLRTLMMLGWLAAFYAVPEGLAAPYSAGFGGGAVATGLVLAALPLGSAAGVYLYGKFVRPTRRLQLMGSLAVGSCAPLLLCALRPGLVISIVILFVAGASSAFQLSASSEFVTAVPNTSRGQAYGFANAGLAIGQGLTISLAGALAGALPAFVVIAVSGGLGTVVAAMLALSWQRLPAKRTNTVLVD
ncbi:MAG TPA: MFS transporter [Pseudonocardiaceae bacterium]|nr:MFS transporter [Pseudonocardiaceae bacterium]